MEYSLVHTMVNLDRLCRLWSKMTCKDALTSGGMGDCIITSHYRKHQDSLEPKWENIWEPRIPMDFLPEVKVTAEKTSIWVHLANIELNMCHFCPHLWYLFWRPPSMESICGPSMWCWSDILETRLELADDWVLRILLLKLFLPEK